MCILLCGVPGRGKLAAIKVKPASVPPSLRLIRAGNETKVTRRDEIETVGHETKRDTRRSRRFRLET